MRLTEEKDEAQKEWMLAERGIEELKKENVGLKEENSYLIRGMKAKEDNMELIENKWASQLREKNDVVKQHHMEVNQKEILINELKRTIARNIND